MLYKGGPELYATFYHAAACLTKRFFYDVSLE
jgi:hypothetical protein